MSINKRYTVDRRNVDNRTFTNSNGGQVNRGSPTRNSKDTSPASRPTPRSRPFGQDPARHGMDQMSRDPPYPKPRYQVVPEQEEGSVTDGDPDVRDSDARRTGSKRDHNGKGGGGDDGLGDERYDGGTDDVGDVDDGDDWIQADDMADPDSDSIQYEKLFMTEEEMLEQSAAELQATIEELEKYCDLIENEGNEWKTRCESQQETNQQLERQILLLQSKVEDARLNVKEAHKTPKDNRNSDNLSEASPQTIKALEREKKLLVSQLRDLEWRMDQESKAYHKANDERKQYVLEINKAKASIGQMKSRHRTLMVPDQEGSSSSRTYRDTTGNIPSDQRIIDPKRGPIRKTAGVKNLPSLESEY
ncbi:uncharacterized protein LOC143299150 [Babylonia areolata]|uniref:uncharacterized protein LOC143299150 n=1 Tax=Babylonia areolata TaxID=304850 RepID=UPI003FD4133D